MESLFSRVAANLATRKGADAVQYTVNPFEINPPALSAAPEPAPTDDPLESAAQSSAGVAQRASLLCG